MSGPVETTSVLSAFADALMTPDGPLPDGLTGPRGGRIERRFAVYRNNVASSLVNALGDIFPTVQRLVGEEFFRAMARVYVSQTPPVSPLLFEYGRSFADFIDGFAPARHLEFLPDVARIERLWLDAFHAADAHPLDPSAIAAVPPERLADVRFTIHPAVALVRSPFAVISIVARDRSGESLAGYDPLHQEDGLISRPVHDVELRHLPPGGYHFLTSLHEGETLGTAAAVALAEAPDTDLSLLIAGALSSGIFTALHVTQPHP